MEQINCCRTNKEKTERLSYNWQLFSYYHDMKMKAIAEKQETEVLRIAYNLGYDPIEDSDVDQEIEIYAYTTDSDYSDENE